VRKAKAYNPVAEKQSSADAFSREGRLGNARWRLNFR